MSNEAAASASAPRTERTPPHSEEAERGVLGAALLDGGRVMDLCVESQLEPDSFFTPAHRITFDILREMSRTGSAIDVLTATDRLRSAGRLEAVGGPAFLDKLVDSTPTAAHAEYYIDIVRQKHLLRCIISCAQRAESDCFSSEESADLVLSKAEQDFFNITERQHGTLERWEDSIKGSMVYIDRILQNRQTLSGISTGFDNLDRILLGMRVSEMIIIAARPGMGKTSLAMNIAENVALGKSPDHTPRPVGIFSLEMSHEALALRMLCSHSRVSGFDLQRGFAPRSVHAKLTQAASTLSKARIYLDDTGGLDIIELRARCRRMKKKYDVELIVIDYLQLLRSKEVARQGRQQEVADISSNLKAMAKELRMPVLVISQLSRAPEQRDKTAKPRLADLRDSGAIEQDADVVCMLRRPCKYEADEEHEDETLAVIEVAKQRNGPTGEVRLNFEADFTRFEDRAHGVDGAAEGAVAQEAPTEGGQ